MTHEVAQLAPWLSSSGPSKADMPTSPGGWLAFAEEANRCGLAGLVLEHARDHEIELPALAFEKLRDASVAIAANNILLKSELLSILRAFNRADLPVMLLKGAALNLTIYQRPDQRPMTDLDLLIRPGTADEVLHLLADHGCRRGLDLVRDDFFPKYHYELELLTGSPSPARIDLHARPLRPLRVSQTMPDDAFWEDAQPIRADGFEAVIPRPELMFIHLAAHAAYHGCARLLWLYDMKRFVDHYGETMDWDLVTRRARQWRLSWPILFAIRRTAESLEPICLPEVLCDLTGHPTSWRDRLALAQAPRDARSPAAHVLVNVLCTPGIRFRLGYLLSFVLPGRSHLAGVYPFRHPGWPACAHAWRVFRALGRALASPVHAAGAALRRVPNPLRRLSTPVFAGPGR